MNRFVIMKDSDSVISSVMWVHVGNKLQNKCWYSSSCNHLAHVTHIIINLMLDYSILPQICPKVIKLTVNINNKLHSDIHLINVLVSICFDGGKMKWSYSPGRIILPHVCDTLLNRKKKELITPTPTYNHPTHCRDCRIQLISSCMLL